MEVEVDRRIWDHHRLGGKIQGPDPAEIITICSERIKMWCPPNIQPIKIWFLDKNDWPVERIKGRPIVNFFRLLIHTKKITTK